MQAQQHQWPNGNQQQVIRGELATQNFNGTFQPRCTRAKQLLWPPQPQGRIFDDQHQCKRGQQLKQFWRFINAPQQPHLRQRAQCRTCQWSQQQGGPESDGGRECFHAGKCHVGTQHEKRAMRKIDGARHSKDQRQPDRHQKQRRRAGQAIEQLGQQARCTHAMALLKLTNVFPKGAKKPPGATACRLRIRVAISESAIIARWQDAFALPAHQLAGNPCHPHSRSQSSRRAAYLCCRWSCPQTHPWWTGCLAHGT